MVLSADATSRRPRDGDADRTELACLFIEKLVTGTAVADRATFDYTALQGLTVAEVSEGRIVCELPVSERVMNRYGTLHGGATATLVDTVSTAALLTACPHSGVSVQLGVNYLAPMPGGTSEVVVVDARVVRVGRQLATLAVELRRKATGMLVAAGSHTKFLQVPDPVMARMAASASQQKTTGTEGSTAAAHSQPARARVSAARGAEESRKELTGPVQRSKL